MSSSASSSTSSSLPSDLYALLEVPRDADVATIKRQYRKMALRYHPDKNPGDDSAEERFKQVAFAYQVLSDQDKRRAYDTHGIDAVREDNGGGHGGIDPSDLFANFFGRGGGMSNGMGDPSNLFAAHLFGGGGGGGGGVFGGQRTRARERKATPAPTTTTAKLTLTQMIRGGCTVTIRFESDTMRTSDGDEWTDVVPACAQCDGAGTVLRTQMIGPGMLQQSTAPCSRCSGSGTLFPETCLTVTEVHEVDIALPTGGVAAQTTPIVLAGKGGTAYVAGERPQACALHVHIERVADDPHADWTLRGHALVWRPKRSAMEGCFMDELFCQHPNGNVYQLRMTDQRADTMVVPQLGLGEGPLLIQVQWQWNRTPWRSQRWFQALSSKLRSQYVHLQHRCTASFDCTTPDAYDAASSARGRDTHEESGEGATPQCRQS